MEYPKRKNPRLKEFDYSSPGHYFITICTKDKQRILSTIEDTDAFSHAKSYLSPQGEVVNREIKALELRYNCIKIDKYVIMPNHIHILLLIEPNDSCMEQKRISVSDIVCTLKSKSVIASQGTLSFQRSYHDHIIRGEADYRKIWEYIDTNIDFWGKDCYFK